MLKTVQIIFDTGTLNRTQSELLGLIQSDGLHGKDLWWSTLRKFSVNPVVLDVELAISLRGLLARAHPGRYPLLSLLFTNLDNVFRAKKAPIEMAPEEPTMLTKLEETTRAKRDDILRGFFQATDLWGNPEPSTPQEVVSPIAAVPSTIKSPVVGFGESPACNDPEVSIIMSCGGGGGGGVGSRSSVAGVGGVSGYGGGGGGGGGVVATVSAPTGAGGCGAAYVYNYCGDITNR